jgi:hypothetical protein
MSHQFRILALPDDWQDLGLLLKSKRQVVFLEELAENGLSRTGNFYTEERLSVYSKVYLVREDAIDRVSTTFSAGLRVDTLRSPVIEAGLCFFDGRLLRAGRLYYETGFYGRDQRWMRKTEDFLRWSASVFRLAKHFLRREPELDSYVGERARQWITGSTHRIALY